MTLACEDAHSKFVEIVSFAEVDAEKRVDKSLVQTLKLKFGHKVDFFCSAFEHKAWSRFQS